MSNCFPICFPWRMLHSIIDNAISARSKSESNYDTKLSNESNYNGNSANESKLKSKQSNESGYSGNTQNESKYEGKKGRVC